MSYYIAKVFTFTEDDNGKCVVDEVYLKGAHIDSFEVDGRQCESEHVEYQHVSDRKEATRFETKEEALAAIATDTANGRWARWHDSTYWPRVKRVLCDNGLWGTVEEE